jgi:hypothetical protein
MDYRISVKFGEGQDYEFRLQQRDLAGSTPESARRWLTQQFHDMGCSPSNPTGKVLLVDKILAVARAMGEKPFAAHQGPAVEFARNALVAFEKRSLSVDVSRLSVG